MDHRDDTARKNEDAGNDRQSADSVETDKHVYATTRQDKRNNQLSWEDSQARGGNILTGNQVL